MVTRRTTTRTRRGFIILPAVDNLNPKIKIQIIDSSSTTTTVMDSDGGTASDNFTLGATVVRPVTDKLGSFTLTISNDEGRFLNKFVGGNTVKIYADFDNATNLIFYGKIDNVKYGLNKGKGFFIEIDGRDFPELIDKTITGQESASTGEVAIAGILNEFYSDIKLQFWNGSGWATATYDSDNDTVSWDLSVTTFPTKQLNFGYQNKKGWKIISEICKRVDLDCYLEYDESGSQWYLRTFIQEAITNTAENISYGANLINLGEYGPDNTNLVNRVIAYGKQESSNIILLKTENDTSSQGSLWIKDKLINASELTTMDEIDAKASFELTEGLSAPNEGKFTAVGLPTLKPGEQIPITIPYTGISGLHKIQTLTHKISKTFTTTVETFKRIKNIQDIFLDKINPDFATDSVNLNNMSDSYTVYFDESPSVMTLSDTSESGGKLRLNSGKITGQATSNIITTDQNNVSACEFRRFENFSTENDNYDVTNDNGVTYEPYSTAGEGIHTFVTEGNQIGFRMTLNRNSSTATSPAYESVCLLFK